MLRVPELDQPPSREAEGAHGAGVERHGCDFSPEEVRQRRLCRVPACGLAPCVGLGNLPADPEDEERGRDADQEHPALGGRVGQELQEGHERRGDNDPQVDRRLEDRGQHRPPPGGPGLRKERGPDRPLPADPEGGQEPEQHQLPPGLRQRAKTRAERVGEDGQGKRPAAPQPVPEPAEEGAPERPADEEGRLDVGALLLHGGVAAPVRAQQEHDKRRRDERVEVELQPVKEPPEPRRRPRLPLPGCDAGEARGAGSHARPAVTSSSPAGRPPRPAPPRAAPPARGTGCRTHRRGRSCGRTSRTRDRRRARRRCPA